MEIEKKQDNDTMVIIPKDRLDASNADEFKEWFDSESKEADKINIDLCDLEYISSAGLRVLLVIHKDCTANGKSYKITNCADTVEDIFKMTGFLDVLNVE